MIILRKITDRTYLEKFKVGEIAQEVLSVLIEGGAKTGTVTPSDIADFTSAVWTNNTFGVPYPLLSVNRDDISSGCRYYSKELTCYGEKLYLTNYWKSSNKDKLIDWILDWIALHGAPVSPNKCDDDCYRVYYKYNVKDGEREEGLCKMLDVEYLEYVYNFARDTLGQFFGDSFPEPIDVVLCKEKPEKVVIHSDEFVKQKMNENTKAGKLVDLEETGEILRHTDYITGRFFENPKPYIEIYFNQFISWGDEFVAEISQTLAHEFMHYLVYVYRKMRGAFAYKTKVVEEALADFFAVMYSLKRAEHRLMTIKGEAARKVVAAIRYETWVKWWGSGWPYSNALYFYRVGGQILPFSYKVDDYFGNGSFAKFVEVFISSKDMREAVKILKRN